MEVKVVVLELLGDWDRRVKVDWRLQDAITHNALLLLLKQVVVGSHPVVFDELTWSPVECILEVFAVIVVEVAFLKTTSCTGATWHAANNWNTISLTVAHFDNLAVEI